MRWPWSHKDDHPRPQVEQAREELERTRAQRPEALAVAAEIRVLRRGNNFRENTFALTRPRRQQ